MRWGVSVRHAGAANRIDEIAGRKYQYNAAGHLTHIDDRTRGATHYTYDPVGRLLSSVASDLKEVFAYDFAGNRVDPEKVPPRPVVESMGERSTREAREKADDAAWLRAHPGEPHPPRRANRTWEENSKIRAWRDALPRCIGNVLTELGQVHHEYDARGNLIQKTEPNGLTWRYTYDARNHLREARRYLKTPAPETLPRTEKLADGGTRWHSGTTNADLAVSFDYDAFGRRVSKRVLPASGPAEVTLFTWDGDVLLMEERFEELPREVGRGRRSENQGFEIVREDPRDEHSLPVAQRMHTLDAGYQ
jgi:YD repeat-containing protein